MFTNLVNKKNYLINTIYPPIFLTSFSKILKLAHPETDPLFFEVKVTGPSAFLRFWTTSLIDCDGNQLLSFKAVATTLRLGSQSKLSVVTPKWSEYSWTNWRFSRFMQGKECERLFCLDWKKVSNKIGVCWQMSLRIEIRTLFINNKATIFVTTHCTMIAHQHILRRIFWPTRSFSYKPVKR